MSFKPWIALILLALTACQQSKRSDWRVAKMTNEGVYWYDAESVRELGPDRLVNVQIQTLESAAGYPDEASMNMTYKINCNQLTYVAVNQQIKSSDGKFLDVPDTKPMLITPKSIAEIISDYSCRSSFGRWIQRL